MSAFFLDAPREYAAGPWFVLLLARQQIEGFVTRPLRDLKQLSFNSLQLIVFSHSFSHVWFSMSIKTRVGSGIFLDGSGTQGHRQHHR